jgi:hypothetical protein
MTLEYQKLGLFALGMVAFVWLAPKLLSIVLGGTAMMTVPRARIADARQPSRPLTQTSAGPESGFSQESVAEVGGDWDAVTSVNATLARLQQRRATTVSRQHEPILPKVAWKVEVAVQAALWRLVALGEAATRMWNARNPLGACLLARAALDNTAALADFNRRIENLALDGNLADIDALVTLRSFKTELDGVDAEKRQSFTPSIGAKAAYEQLCVLTGPESVNQFTLFGHLDKTGTAVAFAESESFDRSILALIVASLRALEDAESIFVAIDGTLARLAALEADMVG